jgi:hypothetical protein
MSEFALIVVMLVRFWDIFRGGCSMCVYICTCAKRRTGMCLACLSLFVRADVRFFFVRDGREHACFESFDMTHTKHTYTRTYTCAQMAGYKTEPSTQSFWNTPAWKSGSVQDSTNTQWLKVSVCVYVCEYQVFVIYEVSNA